MTLTKENFKFKWIKECERSFKELKRRFITTPVLALLKLHKPMEVFNDASRFSLGCILMQEGRVVLLYALSQLKDHEKNYPTHKMELVAMVFIVKL